MCNAVIAETIFEGGVIMGEIFFPPQELEKPRFDSSDVKGSLEREEQYIEDIAKWARKHGKGEYAGETIQFQVADGYAIYVVFSLRPVKLIHVSYLDGYQFEYVHRLTAEDVIEKIEQKKALDELFSKKKEGE